MITVGLSACIFLALLAQSRSASPRVEGCRCNIAALKRIPLLSLTVSKSVHPCTLLDDEFANANSLLLGTTDIRVRSELISVSKSARQVFLSKNLLLFGTTAIRGGVEQCTSVYIAQRRVLLCKNSPLHGTTDIRVRFEMYILVHFWTRVLAKPKHRYCMEPRTSVSVLKCTSLYTFGREFW